MHYLAKSCQNFNHIYYRRLKPKEKTYSFTVRLHFCSHQRKPNYTSMRRQGMGIKMYCMLVCCTFQFSPRE